MRQRNKKDHAERQLRTAYVRKFSPHHIVPIVERQTRPCHDALWLAWRIARIRRQRERDRLARLTSRSGAA